MKRLKTSSEYFPRNSLRHKFKSAPFLSAKQINCSVPQILSPKWRNFVKKSFFHWFPFKSFDDSLPSEAENSQNWKKKLQRKILLNSLSFLNDELSDSLWEELMSTTKNGIRAIPFYHYCSSKFAKSFGLTMWNSQCYWVVGYAEHSL